VIDSGKSALDCLTIRALANALAHYFLIVSPGIR
jgi:hypothetical protein